MEAPESGGHPPPAFPSGNNAILHVRARFACGSAASRHQRLLQATELFVLGMQPAKVRIRQVRACDTEQNGAGLVDAWLLVEPAAYGRRVEPAATCMAR